jgi:hypothetical protein
MKMWHSLYIFDCSNFIKCTSSVKCNVCNSDDTDEENHCTVWIIYAAVVNQLLGLFPI